MAPPRRFGVFNGPGRGLAPGLQFQQQPFLPGRDAGGGVTFTGTVGVAFDGPGNRYATSSTGVQKLTPTG